MRREESPLIEDALQFPIKRAVVFNVGEELRSGYVAIIGIEKNAHVVVAHLEVKLDFLWAGSVTGVDLLQALSLSTQLLDLKMQLVNARIQ